MNTVIQVFLHLDFTLYMILFVCSGMIARMGMSEAFAFKMSKSQFKKENAQRSRVCKIFGIYHASHFYRTKAPHHMKKYAIIRICNLISFLLAAVFYFLIPRLAAFQPVFSTLVVLHAIFLFGSQLVDLFLLSNPKKYGKGLDFDLSKKP